MAKESKKRRYERRLSTTECTALAREKEGKGEGGGRSQESDDWRGRRRLILGVGNPLAPDGGAWVSKVSGCRGGGRVKHSPPEDGHRGRRGGFVSEGPGVVCRMFLG